MKKMQHKKKSISVTLIFSYIVVLAFAISVMMSIYAYIYGILKEQSENLNIAMLDTMTENFERACTEFQSFETSTMNDANFLQLVKMDSESDYGFEYNVNMLRKTLNAQLFAHSSMDGWFIYLKKPDYIITNSAVMDSKNYYKMAVPKEISYDDWIESLVKGATDKHINFTQTDYSEPARECIGYIRGIPLSVVSEKKAVIIAYSYSERFNIDGGAMNGYDEYDMCFQVINNNNDVLLESGAIDTITDVNYDELLKKSGVTNQKINDRRYIVSHSGSKSTNLRYVMYTTIEKYNKNLMVVQIMIFLGMLIIILGESILTFVFFRKMYNPIYEIVTYFDRSFSKKSVYRENEYDFIKNNIKTIIDEKEDIKKTLDVKDEIIKENYLAALLSGKKQLDSETVTIFKTLGICTVTQNFLVVAIKVENVHDLFAEYAELDDVERYKTTLFIIRNVIEELFENERMCEVVDTENVVFCLLNLAERENNENVAKIIKEATSFIYKHFGLVLSVGIGDMHDEKYAIYKSCVEGTEALEFKNVLGKGSVIKYSEISNMKNDDCFFNDDYKNKFINFISVADSQNAENIARELLAKNETDIQKKRAFFRLMYESMEKLGIDKSIMAENFAMLIKEEGVSLNSDAIMQLCQIVEKDTQSDKHLVNQILKFVEKNYSDGNLSIAMIENFIGISGKIISRKFKEATGERLIDYINKYRVDKSKEILKSNNINIDIVANEVGFSSLRTFMRVFKQFEGITPGQYRAAQKK